MITGINKNGGAIKICVCCSGQFKAASNIQKYCFNNDLAHQTHRRKERQRIKNASNSRRSYKVSNRRKRRQHLLGCIKLYFGCIDCGFNSHYEALHFDHLEPKKKSFTIGKTFGTVSIKDLFNEIRKCVIRCANCHAIKSKKNHDYNPLKVYNPELHKTRKIKRSVYV